MIPDLLAPNLPRSVRRRWIVLLGLAPLAALGGFWLDQARHSGNARVTLNRDGAIARGREYARALGQDVTGWREAANVEMVEPRMVYAGARPNSPGTALMRQIAPWEALGVTFQSPGDGRQIRIQFSLDGRPLGYSLRGLVATQETPEAAALALATAVKAADSAFGARLRTGQPEIERRKVKGGVELRTFTWHGILDTAPEIDFQLVVRVEGGQVTSKEIRAEVDPALHSTLRRSSGWLALAAIGIAYGIYMTVVVLYSLYRYVRRSLEREIPHGRSITVALLGAGVLGTQLVNMRDQITIVASGVPAEGGVVVVIAVMMGIFVLLGGALIGLAYGAGEGDVREDNPGKLTSLDALLTGRVLSRNVGLSVLIGAGCAGWLFLALAAAQRPLPSSGLSSTEGLQVLFFRAPLLVFLAGQPLTAMLITVSGLFQPLAFARLNLHRPRVRMAFLIVCALLASASGIGSSGSAGPALLNMIVNAAAILLPFFLCDVLATLAALVTLHSLTMLGMFARLSHDWQTTAAWIAAIGAVTLAVIFYGALRGRLYRELQVRPLYASQIEERRALEAEVSAAREAQLRLLPRDLPHIPGLSVAASCIPAQEVGGDFYDFFKLGPRQLGIFIAEGSGRGLASAMTIALAKGYLMHAVSRSHSPAELLLRLERALGGLLHGATVHTNVAFAVIDAAAGRMRYARTGDYPKAVAVWRGIPVAPSLETVLAPEGRSIPVVEGEVELAPGYGVFLFTDGVAKRLARFSPAGQPEFLARLDADPRRPAEAVHSALFEKLLPRGRKSHQELEDDLTAVVVRFAQRESDSMGVVA